MMGFTRDNVGAGADLRYSRALQGAEAGDGIDLDLGAPDVWRGRPEWLRAAAPNRFSGPFALLPVLRQASRGHAKMAPVPEPATPSAVTLPTLDVRAVLDAAAVRYVTRRLARGAKVFTQGTAATSVYYIEQGGVTLTVVSSSGKEAVVGMLGAGDFCGEGCLAGQATRMGSATTVLPTVVLRIPVVAMQRVLQVHTAFAERFLAHMLARNIRIEEDLVDQLFNSSEKRLARTLLLLARYGKEHGSQRVIPKLSQEILAEMVGTTRSRVNFFMNKFRRLGFIEYNGGLKVHASLMSVVLHD